MKRNDTTNAKKSSVETNVSKSKVINTNKKSSNASKTLAKFQKKSEHLIVTNFVHFYNTQGVLLFKIQIPSIVSCH